MYGAGGTLSIGTPNAFNFKVATNNTVALTITPDQNARFVGIVTATNMFIGPWAVSTGLGVLSVANALTINNGGSGSASGATFNGSSPVTISYNSIGAPSTSGVNATGTWNIVAGSAVSANNVNTVLQTASASYYPTFVNANNASPVAESLYTTSTFVVNPSSGFVGIGKSNPSYLLDAGAGTAAFGAALVAQGSPNVNLQGAWIGWNYSGGGGETNFINQLGGGSAGGFNWQNSTTGNSRTTVMTLLANGNLGIGTSSPGAKLDVSGGDVRTSNGLIIGSDQDYIYQSALNILSFRVGTSTNQTYFGFKASSGLPIIDGPGGALALGTSGTERMRIDSSGNVLVGTTTASWSASGRGNVTVGGSSSAILSFQVGGADKGYLFNDGTNIQLLTNVAGSLIFSTNTVERMRIDSSGNVGIGTTTPGSKFSVVGGSLSSTGQYALNIASGLTTGRIGTYDAATASAIHTYYDNGSVEISSGSTSGYVSGISLTGYSAGGNYAGTLRFATLSAERMRIDSAGNVGIGTSSPGNTLTVNGTSQVISSAGETDLKITNSSTNGRDYWLISGGSSGAFAGGSFGIWDNTAGATRLSVNSSGNITINNSLTVGSNLTVTGNAYATNLNATYALPANLGSPSWINLGTFTAGQTGNHCFIKVVTSVGYNAVTGQQSEIYIHFTTSNGASVDTNGFAGWTSFYITNTENPGYNVAVVANAAGTSATAFTVYFYQAGNYDGNGAFYTVETSQPNGTWVNSATLASAPASASSTVQYGTNQYWIQSNTTVTGNLSVSGNVVNPKLQGYTEVVTVQTATSAALTINLAASNIVNLTLSSNTTVGFINTASVNIADSMMIVAKQDGVGSRIITWPSNVKWPNGSAPALSTAANAIDVLNFITIDGGATYYGALSLANLH